MSVLLEKLGRSLKTKKTGRLDVRVSSTDRAFGTLFGSEIIRTCGNGLPEDSYVITCHGGGVAYVLDGKHDLYLRLNKEQVQAGELTEAHDIAELRCLIEEHVAATGSLRGKKILAAFQSYVPCFKKVMPRDYDRMLRAMAQCEERGMDREQAEIEAFYSVTRG